MRFVDHGRSRVGVVLDTGREQVGGQVVAPWRQLDGDLVLGGASVELGGSPGPGAGPAAAAPEDDVEQARGDEPVEVERGERAADPDRGRCFISIDGVAAPGDELIEAATDRLGEGGNPIDRVGGTSVHVSSLSRVATSTRLTIRGAPSISSTS